MLFYCSKNSDATRMLYSCSHTIIPLCLLLMSCGFDVKSGLVRQKQNNESTFDTYECSLDSGILEREFLALRKRLTGHSPKCSTALDNLAQSQSDWLLQNKDLKHSVKPHEQREGTPGFSGVTLAARMERQNLKTDQYVIAETIAQGEFSEDVWRAYLGSVLHRSIFLAPGLTAFGYAQNPVATVLTAAVSYKKREFEPVFYPQPSEKVGTARLLSERPAQDLAAVGMGFPISVHFPWGCSDLRVLRFSVQHAGIELASKIFTKKELAKLSSSEVFLVADEVLPASKEIEVDANIECGSKSFTKMWRFQTQ